MAKLNKKSTSNDNCRVNSEKNRSNAYLKRRRKLKAIQQKRKRSTNNGSYQLDSNTNSVHLSDPDHYIECCSHVENDNELQCNSDHDLSLAEPVVDSYECITIEDDSSTDKSCELKNPPQKRHKQFDRYLSPSLKRQYEGSDDEELSPDMISIKIKFEEDIKLLQECIQSQINHGRRRRINPDLYFTAIKRLNNNCYIKRLLQEIEELDKEFKSAKKRLNRKCDLIINKVSLVQSLYCKIKELIKFSMHQRKVILFKVRWMKSIKNKLSKRGRKVIDIPMDDATTYLPVESIAKEPQMGSRKFHEEEVSADISFIPLEFPVNLPREGMVFDNNCDAVHQEISEEKLNGDNSSEIDLRHQELSDAKEKAAMLLEQLKSTQEELQRVSKELNEQVSSIQENADCELEKMKVHLSEIRTMLKEKMGSTTKIPNILENDSDGVTCHNLLWDIRWLIEDCANFKRAENIKDTAITSDGVQVTENEVHLLILIAFFLKVIPFTVTTEFIHSYLKNVDNSISLQFVTSLLNKFPGVFKEESVAPGSLEKKWCYLSLSPIINI